VSIKVDQALLSTALNGGLEIDIVHENGVYSVWDGGYTHSTGVYTPDANREHMEVRNFPADVTAQSLKDSDEHTGLFQAIIKYPLDIGATTIKNKAEDFLALFVIGQAVTYGGESVYPVSKNRDGGRVEGGFYQIVCRVNYRAFISRG